MVVVRPDELEDVREERLDLLDRAEAPIAAQEADRIGINEDRRISIEIDVAHPQLRGVDDPLCALVHSCSADVVRKAG